MKPYMNLHLFTDARPYEVVRVVSSKCVVLREMRAKLAEGEKPEILPGGFAGHCTNQRSLKYDITGDPAGDLIRARLHKNGQWHSSHGRHVPSDKPVYFYDYNF